LGSAEIDTNGVHINLLDLMGSENQAGANVQLTIQKASLTTSENETVEVSGTALQTALSENISSAFVTTEALSDAWVLDLAPLVYPNAP